MSASPTVVLAWGNPGRRDDGLGPAFAEALAARALPEVLVSAGYHLQVEDAADLAGCGRVLFVDADRGGSGPYRLRPLVAEEDAGPGLGFSSHGISPARLLGLARDLFGAAPEAWLMGIRGYDFDRFGEGLSARARANLAAAVAAACEFVSGEVGAAPRAGALRAGKVRGGP